MNAAWDQAAVRSLAAWGLAPTTVELVSHSENLVYRVTADGTDYGLRLHRPGYHRAIELRSELEWLSALTAAGCQVPKPQTTLAGEHLATVTSGEDTRQASLVNWVGGHLVGTRLAQADPGERFTLVRQIGVHSALLHASATAWQPPIGFERVHWDADGLMGEQPAWGRFWEVAALSQAQQRLLLHTRDLCKEKLDALRRTTECYSMIHADMHPFNLIWTGDGIHVIDFDDSGFGWHAYDVAVALYNFRNDADFDAIRDAFFDGYRTVRSDAAIAELPLGFWFGVRSLVWLGWLADRPDIADSQRMSDAVKLVCEEAEEHPP